MMKHTNTTEVNLTQCLLIFCAFVLGTFFATSFEASSLADETVTSSATIPSIAMAAESISSPEAFVNDSVSGGASG